MFLYRNKKTINKFCLKKNIIYEVIIAFLWNCSNKQLSKAIAVYHNVFRDNKKIKKTDLHCTAG